MRIRALLIVSGLAFLSGLTSCSDYPQSDNLIRVEMSPAAPGENGRLRWSPKGEKLVLHESSDGFNAELHLGPESLAPVNILLSASEKGGDIDRLALDMDRDGRFDGEKDTLLTCIPKERRGKTWSSFSCELSIPFKKMKHVKAVVNPYPLSFWYVYDSLSEETESYLRYSRRGWMEGEADTEFGKIRLLLTEMTMDGVFDREDSWTIAPDTSRQDLYLSKYAKQADTHNWLGEQAFGIDSLLPSGRVVWIKTVDPQITRAQEEAQNDWLAPDRAVKHSGTKVNFLHDYEKAVKQAKQEGKLCLLDFETTWCGPCHTMDQWVYNADTVVALAQKIVSVKIDGDDHRDLVKKYKVSGYPTLILLSPEGEVLKQLVGYQSVTAVTSLISGGLSN